MSLRNDTPELDLSALPEKEREELFLFYNYLKFKVKQTKSAKTKKQKIPETFLKPIEVSEYLTFDRDEIYDRK